MLSLVLPLLILAIALTPIVVSARMLYKREMAAPACEDQVVTAARSRQPSVSAKTTV